jgi:hypothetical protein
MRISVFPAFDPWFFTQPFGQTLTGLSDAVRFFSSPLPLSVSPSLCLTVPKSLHPSVSPSLSLSVPNSLHPSVQRTLSEKRPDSFHGFAVI